MSLDSIKNLCPGSGQYGILFSPNLYSRGLETSTSISSVLCSFIHLESNTISGNPRQNLFLSPSCLPTNLPRSLLHVPHTHLLSPRPSTRHHHNQPHLLPPQLPHVSLALHSFNLRLRHPSHPPRERPIPLSFRDVHLPLDRLRHRRRPLAHGHRGHLSRSRRERYECAVFGAEVWWWWETEFSTCGLEGRGGCGDDVEGRWC